MMNLDQIGTAVGLFTGIFGIFLSIYFGHYYRRGARITVINDKKKTNHFIGNRWSFQSISSLFQNRPIIEFVTDGSFIDSALFQLAVVEASANISEVNIVLRQTEWSKIPAYVGENTCAIGYFNRRSIPVSNGVPIYPLNT